MSARSTRAYRRESPLTTEQRAELLARADVRELVGLADRCVDELGVPVVLSGPDMGTVMMQVREPVVGERFHLGEVVASRAEVEIAGRRGWSMRMGTDRVAALAGAICDAVAAMDSPHASDVDELCRRTADRLDAAAREEWAELAATEVRFEELDS